jgi:hypothetical protein
MWFGDMISPFHRLRHATSGAEMNGPGKLGSDTGI